jgi:flagellar basal-body rod protein FlgB
VIDRLFETTAFRAIELALDANSVQSRLIADNIANVDTPNYKALRLSFEDTLASKLNAEAASGSLPLLRTNPLHIPGIDPLALNGARTDVGTIYTDNSLTFRLDGNNVDIDHETAEQAKVAIQYSALIELAGRRLASLRTIISEGSR